MTTRLAIALAATLGLAMPAYSQAATPATQAAQAAKMMSETDTEKPSALAALLGGPQQ